MATAEVIVRYIGPIDEVDVIGVGVLKHGDEVAVSAEVAESLLAQTDNYEAAPAAAKKKG